jgi:hypothetical protein
MIVDPKRLFDEDDTDLSAAIGAARRRVPSRERMNAMAGRLARLGVAVPPEFRPELSAGEMPAAATATGAVSKGVVVALGVAGVALLGVLAAVGLSSRTGAQSEVVAAKAQPAETAAATTTSRTGAGAAPVVDQGVPAPAERKESVAVAPSSNAAVKAPATPGASPARRVTGPTVPPKEIELLKRARSALSSEPSLSLQLVEQARQSFPRSAFGQEREFIAISALYGLGRRAEAGAREQAFRERHPRSAYLPQLDRLSSSP